MKAIDLFAGLGGFSEGARQAGVEVVWAANHWQIAVDHHAENHPEIQHLCQDLHQADWTQVPDHDILLASPACQGHTRARGKERPHHDACRATAWAVVSAIECHRPAFGIVENVPEFQRWALYQVWIDALEQLGYSASSYIIDAADHGVPQNRVRLFIVLTKGQTPLQVAIPKRPHVPASSIIELDAGRWSQIERPGRSLNTLSRIRNGRQRHGARFLTAYYGNERGGRSLDRPIGTITTRDRWAIVDGDRMRMLSVGEARAAMAFPEHYRLPKRSKDAMHMLGNAVAPPVARDVIAAIGAAA